MFSERINKLQKTVAGGAMIIAFFSILSRLLGLLRDRFLSSTFGAGQVLDSYYAAFRLPDLIFNTIVLGALSSAFIPVFLEYWNKDKEEAWRITNGLLNFLFLAVLIFSIFIFIFAPSVIDLMVPGFNQEARDLTTSLTRVMLFGTIFFTLSNVASGVLNSLQKFFIYSLAPVMYNVGIIFGILVLAKEDSFGLVGLGWGVALGALLHFLIQVPTLLKIGYRWKPILNFKHPAVEKIGFLMLPRCFGLAISQFNFIVTTFIASGLAIGAVAIYNLAFNLVNFPVSIFGISLAISVFPILSRANVNGDKECFVLHFSSAIRQILYLIVPTTILFLSLRAQIVRLVLGAGVFSWRDTVLTSQTLGWFSLSLFAQSLIPVFARAFYAKQDTKTPVKIAVVSFLINIIGCFVFGKFMGVGGLALAFTISSVVNFVLLYFFITKKVVFLPSKKILKSFLKIFGLSILMLGVVQIIKYSVAPIVDMQTFIGVLTQSIAAIIGGSLFYLLMSLWLKFDEVTIVVRFFDNKFKFFNKIIK